MCCETGLIRIIWRLRTDPSWTESSILRERLYCKMGPKCCPSSCSGWSTGGCVLVFGSWELKADLESAYIGRGRTPAHCLGWHAVAPCPATAPRSSRARASLDRHRADRARSAIDDHRVCQLPEDQACRVPAQGLERRGRRESAQCAQGDPHGQPARGLDRIAGSPAARRQATSDHYEILYPDGHGKCSIPFGGRGGDYG